MGTGQLLELPAADIARFGSAPHQSVADDKPDWRNDDADR